MAKYIDKDKVIEELKKRIEQKHTDKVEPKFKIGDWIVSNEKLYVYQIEEINDFVAKVNENGVSFVVDVKCLNDTHLWTIQDAKEGDVLVRGCVIFVFNYLHGYKLNCKCSIHKDGYVITEPHDLMTVQFFSEVSPATKEQRDLLFAKMNETGYEWDAENKELKKISQRMVSAEAKEALYDKPTWSEEDEVKINRIVACLENLNVADNDILLKDVDWLKSIKERYTWKPSDEQMKALHDLNLTGNISYAGQGQTLIELYDDLKKLK